MEQLQVFENAEFGKVRTVEIDGDVWFLGSDVAMALQYSDKNKAVTMHVDNEDKKTLFYKAHDVLSDALWDKINDFSDKIMINESGVYSMVFSSKLPSAKKFKHWVTSEILPSIRKTGSYSLPKISYAESLRMLADKVEENERLKLEVVQMSDKISEMQPKVTYYDEILSSDKTVLTTQIAKDYGMSARTFNRKLHELGIQYKVGEQWVLYSKYQGMGYTHSKTHSYPIGNGSYGTAMQTEWRQSGRLFLYDLLKQNGILPLIEKE